MWLLRQQHGYLQSTNTAEFNFANWNAASNSSHNEKNLFAIPVTCSLSEKTRNVMPGAREYRMEMWLTAQHPRNETNRQTIRENKRRKRT